MLVCWDFSRQMIQIIYTLDHFGKNDIAAHKKGEVKSVNALVEEIRQPRCCLSAVVTLCSCLPGLLESP